MGAEITYPGSLAFYGPQTPNTKVTLFFLIRSHGQDLIFHLPGKTWWLLPLKWPQVSPLKLHANPSIYTLSSHTTESRSGFPFAQGYYHHTHGVLYLEGTATLWQNRKFLVLFSVVH